MGKFGIINSWGKKLTQLIFEGKKLIQLKFKHWNKTLANDKKQNY